MADKTLLVPGEYDYEENIGNLAEEILNGITEDEYPMDDNEGGYAIEIVVLDYVFPVSGSDKETVAEDLAKAIAGIMSENDDFDYGDLTNDPKVHFTEDFLIVG